MDRPCLVCRLATTWRGGHVLLLLRWGHRAWYVLLRNTIFLVKHPLVPLLALLVYRRRLTCLVTPRLAHPHPKYSTNFKNQLPRILYRTQSISMNMNGLVLKVTQSTQALLIMSRSNRVILHPLTPSSKVKYRKWEKRLA